MYFEFSKYHGTGNDFIIIDDRSALLSKRLLGKPDLIARMCDRNFGVGADGLILLLHDEKSHFRMVYFNADGNEGSFCGNGSRCVVAFAHMNKIINHTETVFTAVDGEHRANIECFEHNKYKVSIEIGANAPPEKMHGNKYFVDTGSPHLVILVDDLSRIDVNMLGKNIRYSREWSNAGVNVNFVQITGANHLAARTYERGVEQETLSCGTGVTAASIVAFVHLNKCNEQLFFIDTLGGRLEVSMSSPQQKVGMIDNIRLIGPAEFVFKGEYCV